MKKPALANNSNTKKGVYRPINPHKYIRDYTNIIYRSSWEMNFMIYLDTSDMVSEWCSEYPEIKYDMPDNNGKMKEHTYFPDFYVSFIHPKYPEDRVKCIFEIKPYKDTIEPIVPMNVSTPQKFNNLVYNIESWKKNSHKWLFADNWCQQHGFKFKVIHENNVADIVGKKIFG